MKVKNLFMALTLTMGLAMSPAFADDDVIMDVDDNAATFSGTWHTSTNRLLYYGDDYQYAWGSGSSTTTAEAIWTTAKQADLNGRYAVFVRWSVAPNREETAYYRVYDGVADTTVNCGCAPNQTVNGGAWQYCCTTNLTAGNNGVVKLGNENTLASEVVVADGVRFVRETVDGADILDNSVTSTDIANGTIRDYDIADEAGLDYVGANVRDVATLALCSATNWTNVATLTSTYPTNGYVSLSTSGYYNPGVAYNYTRVCISPVSTGRNCHSHAPIMEREGSTNYAYEMRWALNEVQYIDAGGARSFYLKACREATTTTGQIGYNDFTGIFVPTRYY